MTHRRTTVGRISTIERTLAIDAVEVPRFLYGTAWKEDQTQHLVELALESGFRGIDTANQRRHNDEAAVGRAIAASIAKGLVTREDVFLQTTFTFRRGQDHRLPCDPGAPVPIQVEQSFASSLEHLGVERIDSYLLHGPTGSAGLTPDDWARGGRWRPSMPAAGRGCWASATSISNNFSACGMKPAFVPALSRTGAMPYGRCRPGWP